MLVWLISITPSTAWAATPPNNTHASVRPNRSVPILIVESPLRMGERTPAVQRGIARREATREQCAPTRRCVCMESWQRSSEDSRSRDTVPCGSIAPPNPVHNAAGRARSHHRGTLGIVPHDVQTWVTQVFDHPGEGPEWWWDPAADAREPAPDECVALQTLLFRDPVRQLARFSDPQ